MDQKVAGVGSSPEDDYLGRLGRLIQKYNVPLPKIQVRRSTWWSQQAQYSASPEGTLLQSIPGAVHPPSLLAQMLGPAQCLAHTSQPDHLTILATCHTTCAPIPLQVEFRDVTITTQALVGSAAVPTVGSSFINLAKVRQTLWQT